MNPQADRFPSVTVCASRDELGRNAADQAAKPLRSALELRGRARLMLAAAESQRATLAALSADPSVDWSRVECFHMDEYIGLPQHAPQRFSNWLQVNFFSKLPVPPIFHRLMPTGSGSAEALRYEAVMGTAPFDAVLLGLGVNAHLAFNDPPADLSDARAARVVSLDAVSRQQQVDEGYFSSLHDVPRVAVTVTIPRLLNSISVIASVPGKEKRRAVTKALTMPISGLCPGTALRTHPQVNLYLDPESAPEGFSDTWAEQEPERAQDRDEASAK